MLKHANGAKVVRIQYCGLVHFDLHDQRGRYQQRVFRVGQIQFAESGAVRVLARVVRGVVKCHANGREHSRVALHSLHETSEDLHCFVFDVCYGAKLSKEPKQATQFVVNKFQS